MCTADQEELKRKCVGRQCARIVNRVYYFILKFIHVFNNLLLEVLLLLVNIFGG